VTVENLETSLVKAVELGAKVHKAVTTTPMGRFAIIADPHGALIGLWQFATWPAYDARDIALPERGGA
jgi:predicted enzyme related to lactoylglutathione lyase